MYCICTVRALWKFSKPPSDHPVAATTNPAPGIKMEVGIEDCLHIEFEFDRQKYHLKVSRDLFLCTILAIIIISF